MKKIIVLIMALTVATGAYCQSKIPDSRKDTLNSRIHPTTRDCLVMKGGVVKMWKGGQVIVVTGPVTLNNGTTVDSDGSIKMKDGSSAVLKDGQLIDMDGNIGSAKSNSSKQAP
jgi:hypothetical protein